MDELNLQQYREIINGIDKNLVSVFEQRMETVKMIADYKRKNKMKILDAEREKKVIENAVSNLKNRELEKYLRFFIDDLLTLCRQYQIDSIANDFPVSYEEAKPDIMPGSTIGYYGLPGSYCEEAAIEYFGRIFSGKSYQTFDEVISALSSGEIDIGVLPIENSSTGTITEVIDLIRDNNVYIVGEHILAIRHNLLALPGAKLSDIKTVYSHVQGLEQSAHFLKKYAWEQIIYKSTANSAKLVRDLGDKTNAAIASSRCAEVYGLEILVPDIHYNKNNYTRFILVGRELVVNKACDKISIVMDIAHKPGALYNVLRLFNEQNINIMKIESRPIIERPWEYLFFFDFEGNLENERVKILLESLKNISHQFRLLGNYRNSERRVI
ncbi:MAG: prephenate dehydratase [Clostridiaceae bacterium]|nr:prephenate dehydratase [Clostridiaceae bacterium]